MTDQYRLDQLLDEMQPDRWRASTSFSSDMYPCQGILFDPTVSRLEKADALGEWLGSKAQPCLFGRIAAAKGWLSFCILTESDIARGDDHVRQVIQEHRRTWKAEARSGGRHGFVIVAASQRLAMAEPGPALRDFALPLCELYLSVAELGIKHHDELFLRIDRDRPASIRKWKVGVNVFASQADGRWWRDHRIPGGLAFSMNSVGHMARRLAEDAIRKDAALAARAAGVPAERLERWALPLAMKTIREASRGPIPGARLIARQTVAGSPDAEARRAAALGDLATVCTFWENAHMKVV
jgi:hypothetical protein